MFDRWTHFSRYTETVVDVNKLGVFVLRDLVWLGLIPAPALDGILSFDFMVNSRLSLQLAY